MKKIKINYYDLGAHCGEEAKLMHGYFEKMSIGRDIVYKIHAIEADKGFAGWLFSDTAQYNRRTWQVYNFAISDRSGPVKLYHSEDYRSVKNKDGVLELTGGNGNSIFASKSNVTDKYNIVPGIPFSLFLENESPDFRDCFNILKVNIEGAEWHLFNDLIKNDLVKYFHIFCGDGYDIEKIGELSDKVDEYYKMLKDNNIKIYRFTEHKPEQNELTPDLLWEKIQEYRKENVYDFI